jgi:tetratricopeptide (TPR) repeat protein
MADESPLPESVNILVVCSGRARVVTFTDRKGHFVYQSGQRQGLADPDLETPGGSANGNLRSVGQAGGGPLIGPSSPGGAGASGTGQVAGLPLLGCALKADLPGYTSSVINLDGHLGSENPNVGTLVLSRSGKGEGLAVSSTSMSAPPDARKAYDRGLDNMHKGKMADAEKDFEKAVGIYPKYANAWLDLAKLRLLAKRTEPAREAFQKALDADDKMVEAHVQLGTLAAGEHQWPDAVKHFDTALQLDPVDFPQIWFSDAVANFNVKKFDVAEKSAREALKLDPMHGKPEEDRLLGLILASAGRFGEALEELKIYLKFAPEGPDAEQVKGQIAQIEKLQAQAAH